MLGYQCVFYPIFLVSSPLMYYHSFLTTGRSYDSTPHILPLPTFKIFLLYPSNISCKINNEDTMNPL